LTTDVVLEVNDRLIGGKVGPTRLKSSTPELTGVRGFDA
jgi:hypothetical protein